MSKYKLTLEQFKMVIMPFIDAALEANAAEVKYAPFNVARISAVQPTNKNLPNLPSRSIDQFNDFKIEFTVKGYIGYFRFSIKQGVSMQLVDCSASPITSYLLDHKAEINEALRVYMYEHYGEEYKDYIIEFYTEKKEENLEYIKQKRERLKKELAELDKEEKENIENYDAEIQDIDNLLTPHHI